MTFDDAPIFIGGLAHSGKTQLRSVLEAHPDLSMTRRTYMWNRFYGRFGDLHEPTNLESCLAAIVADRCVAQLKPDEERILRAFYEGPLDYPHLFALFHQQHAEQLGKRRWGDQLKFVERFADPIFNAFPRARMIHMIRDPRARRADVKAHTAPRRGSLGWDTAMWLHSIELAEHNKIRYAGRYLVLQYETLRARPQETIGSLCQFLDEDFVHRMRVRAASLEFDAHDCPVEPSTELPFFDIYAGRAIAAQGYERLRNRLSAPDRMRFLITEWPVNRMTMAAWRAVRRRRSTRTWSSL